MIFFITKNKVAFWIDLNKQLRRTVWIIVSTCFSHNSFYDPAVYFQEDLYVTLQRELKGFQSISFDVNGRGSMWKYMSSVDKVSCEHLIYDCMNTFKPSLSNFTVSLICEAGEVQSISNVSYAHFKSENMKWYCITFKGLSKIMSRNFFLSLMQHIPTNSQLISKTFSWTS